MQWHKLMGFNEKDYRFHDHDKLAHMQMQPAILNLSSHLVSKS